MEDDRNVGGEHQCRRLGEGDEHVGRHRVAKHRVARECHGEIQERREEKGQIDRSHHPLGRRGRQGKRRLDFLRDVVSSVRERDRRDSVRGVEDHRLRRALRSFSPERVRGRLGRGGALGSEDQRADKGDEPVKYRRDGANGRDGGQRVEGPDLDDEELDDREKEDPSSEATA